MSRAQHLSSKTCSSVCMFFNPTFGVKILCFSQERNKVICESNLQLFLSNLKTLMLHSMHQCCHHWHWLWRQWRKIIGALHCQSCCVNDKKNKTTSVVKDDIRSCSSNSWSPWWTVVATADPLFCWNNIFVSNDDQVELTFSKKQRFDKGPSA